MKTLILFSLTLLIAFTYSFGEEIGNCWPLIQVICERFDQKCTQSNECPTDQQCCKYECGTTCLAEYLIGHRPGFQARQHCWDLNEQLVCKRFDQKCVNNEECGAQQICCQYECGTQCRNKDLIGKKEQKRSLEPSPKKGCPPIETELRCFWFNKTCDKDSDCKEKDNICCADNCGTFCHKPE